MLFEQWAWAGIADGTITVTFRRWKRRQAVAGRRYRTPAGLIETDAVDVIAPNELSDDDARRSGYPSAASVLADLHGSDDVPIYRIRFHVAPGPDPRAELAADADVTNDEIAEIDRRLQRLDRASTHGAWTADTLHAIASRPGVRAGDLATALGRERDPFKIDVRKLKALGLTYSLEVGYELSPRGRAYLDSVSTTRRG